MSNNTKKTAAIDWAEVARMMERGEKIGLNDWPLLTQPGPDATPEVIKERTVHISAPLRMRLTVLQARLLLDRMKKTPPRHKVARILLEETLVNYIDRNEDDHLVVTISEAQTDLQDLLGWHTVDAVVNQAMAQRLDRIRTNWRKAAEIQRKEEAARWEGMDRLPGSTW